MVQFRQQVEKKATQLENKQENQAEQEMMTTAEQKVLKDSETATEHPFDSNSLENPSFGIDVAEFTGKNGCLWPSLQTKRDPEVWALNQAISEKEPEYGGLFDDNLLVSSNFASTWNARISTFWEPSVNIHSSGC